MKLRPNNKPINIWKFGKQKVETRVYVMVPHNVEEMVVNWEEFIEKNSSDPFEFAVKLKEKLNG